MPTILDDVLPVDLGLPSKFKSFRQIQREITDFSLYGPASSVLTELGTRRFACVGAAPGAGKSLFAHALGQLSGMKYVVLTATKSLEDQQVNDGFNLVNVRGKSNYTCLDHDPLHPDQSFSCEEGEVEWNCNHFGTNRCTYSGRVNEFKYARAGLTNYSYWLHARSKNRKALEGKGDKIGLLICDEFHLAAKALASFLGVWVSNDDLHKWVDDEIRAVVRLSRGAEWGRVNKRWVDALDTAYIRMITRMAEIAVEYQTEQEAMRQDREYRKLARISDNIERIVTLGNDNNWIWRATKGGIAFDCIWPGRYAERYLWSGVEKIVLVSATLRPKAMQLVNVRSSDYWYKEWPRVFAAELSPVYWLPTGSMGMRKKNETYQDHEARLEKCVEQVDRILDEWGHLKGIIHTASYQRAEWLQMKSRYGRYMILNEPGEATDAAKRFKESEAPSLLVSPSYTTGFDFPDSECEFQIIIKLPYADRSDPVTQARSESDEQYYAYETMQTLVQTCGRGSRHEKDRCTTFITDDAVRNFRNYARQFAPKWFRVLDAPGGRIPHAPR